MSEAAEQTNELRAVNRELYNRNAELFHKLRLVELELSRSEALRELLEIDSRGIRVTQTSQKEALRAIRAAASVSPDSALKTKVQHILKGLEL